MSSEIESENFVKREFKIKSDVFACISEYGTSFGTKKMKTSIELKKKLKKKFVLGGSAPSPRLFRIESQTNWLLGITD